MKKLLATTVIATMAFTGAASAQSLLERVLRDLDGVGNTDNITGIFANTADNLNRGALQDTISFGGQLEFVVDDGTDRFVFSSEADYQAFLQTQIDDSIATIITDVDGDGLPTGTFTFDGVSGLTLQQATDAAEAAARAQVAENTEITNTGATTFFSTSGINASVTNILRGIDGPTAVSFDSAGNPLAQATAAVNGVIGNISTTALGAVNTGTIELRGSNIDFDEEINQALAGTSNAVRERIQHTVNQVGSVSDQTMLALNSALNETNINASVFNSMEGVNATIGRSGFEVTLANPTSFASIATMDADAIAALTGGISTTALGAVNTGSIISGTDNQVSGVISSIVGNAATNVGGNGGDGGNGSGSPADGS